jgi:hypothetical protein
VEHEDRAWRVCPVYIAPVGIGEAVAIAKRMGWQLPTPELADAIFYAADLKVEPLPQVHNGTIASMAEAYAAQEARIGEQIAGHVFAIVDGTHKNVTRDRTGRVGLYGWHTESALAYVHRGFTEYGSIPTHPARTGSARIIQPFFAGHAPAWKDGSQGFRPVIPT